MMIDISRRRFFSLLAAPAIVRVASIMPVVAPWFIMSPVTMAEYPPMAVYTDLGIKLWSKRLMEDSLKASWMGKFIGEAA